MKIEDYKKPLLIGVVSIIAGIMYNILLTYKTGCGYVTEYIAFLITLTLAAGMLWWVLNNFLVKVPLQTTTAVSLAFVLALLIHNKGASSEIIFEALFTAIISLGFVCAINAHIKKEKMQPFLPLFIVIAQTVTYLVAGASEMIFITLTLSLILFAGVRFHKTKIKGIKYSALVIFFITFTLSVSGTELWLVKGFINPFESEGYSEISQILRSAQFFNKVPLLEHGTNANLSVVAPYAHLIQIFGILPACFMVAWHMLGAFQMFLCSIEFKETHNKMVGTACASALAIQTLMAMGSSFILAPLNPIGAPFLTTDGLQYCVIPLVIFILTALYDGKSEKRVSKSKKIAKFRDETFVILNEDK